jgi:hypothetical protein
MSKLAVEISEESPNFPANTYHLKRTPSDGQMPAFNRSKMARFAQGEAAEDTLLDASELLSVLDRQNPLPAWFSLRRSAR